MTDFTRNIPTLTGVYQVRGWAQLDGEPHKQAIVAVERNTAGELVCNLHRETSCHNLDEWYEVASLDPQFEWRGPMVYVPFGQGGDKRVSDDTYLAAVSAARSQLGPRRPGHDEPEEQWHWDKLTELMEILDPEVPHE